MQASQSMSLDCILLAVTEDYLKNSADTARTFAETKLYPQLQLHKVPGPSGPESAKDADDYTRRVNNMQNTFSRIMNRTSLIPLAWLWAWVDALPGEYRTRVLNEFRAQLPEALPSASGASALADMGALAKEAGEALSAVASIAADGVYDGNDDPAAARIAIEELYDVSDIAAAEARAIEKGTGITVSRSRKLSAVND